MRVSAPALILAVVLALAACGGDDEGDEGAATGATIETITISETDFKLDPATVDVDEPGVYTFHVVNDGNSTHALEIEGGGIEEESEDLAPGGSADLKVELKEDGEYELYCPIGNHRELGMEGTLSVGGGGATTDEDEDTGGSDY